MWCEYVSGVSECFFFFSSRRRHTRCSRDWSSDVCSSDLVAYMAVFSSALAYVFYFWLLRYLEASQLAAFTYLLPVLATILGILWLGERGSWGQLLSGVMAPGGVFLIEARRAPGVNANTVPYTSARSVVVAYPSEP